MPRDLHAGSPQVRPSLRTSRQWLPSAIETPRRHRIFAIVQQFYQIYLDGVTIDEARRKYPSARGIRRSTSISVLGDDETMVLMAKLPADQYRHLVSVNIVTCYKYVSGERIDISRLLTPELDQT